RPVRIVRRQVFDIPTITVRVVEHRLVSRRCPCGTVTQAAGPAGVSAPVSYGPHAAAIAVYLCLGQHLPVERTAGLLAEVFGTPMATGTVAAWTSRAAAGLAPFTAAAVAGSCTARPPPPGAEVPAGWCWAGQVIEALLGLKAITDTGTLPGPDVLAAHRRLIVSAALIGASAEVGPPGAVGRRHRALA